MSREKKTRTSFSPEVRERGIRLVLEHERSIGQGGPRSVSVAAKIGRLVARRRRSTNG
jgi:hypothetical protein